MNRSIPDIMNEFVRISLENEEIYSKACTVTSVDEVNRTCEVEPVDDSGTLFDVKLQAVTANNQGICIFPKVGSYVLVTFTTAESGFVSLYSEIYKLSISNGTNDIKSILNDLITAIKALTVPTAWGPSGTPINSAQFDTINSKINNLFE